MKPSDRCWLARPRDRCGVRPHLKLRRTLAIGDVIAATAVADKLAEQGLVVTLQCNDMVAGIARRCPSILGTESPSSPCDINLDGVYEKDPLRTQRHFHEMFFESANRQLQPRGIAVGPPTNCLPRLTMTPHEIENQRLQLARFARPWTLICPRSAFYAVRTVPDGIWVNAAQKLPGTVFWIGMHEAPKPIVGLKVNGMAHLPIVIAAADFLLTVDTGPMHIAAAVGVPMLVMNQSSSPELHLSDQVDYETVSPNLGCLNCQKNKCPIRYYEPPCQSIPPESIAAAAERRLRAIMYDAVSCVIPTYRAPADRLNRCLQAVLPQVREVIVTRAADGEFPKGCLQDPKIRYVTKYQREIGFGRNVNYGVRHSANRYVLILNDDVYLAPDAVARMLDEMRPDVGLVGHLLKYPDNRIYHGGVARALGTLDWGHIDHGRYEPTITSPREMEQVTGASILIRRQAFYAAGGYDENFFLYCEDNDLCMKVRQAGWKIWYTPRATGIHEGSATARQRPDMMDRMRESQRYFHEKWDWYLQKNRHIPLGVFA